MELEHAYATERAKWDDVARGQWDDVTAPPPYGSFEAFAASDGRLPGVTAFLGNLRGKRVLEYGCGLGKLTVLLARTGARVSAFDISPASVAATRRRAEANDVDVDVTVAVGEDLPYDDGSFDVVIGVAVLHHLRADAAAAELRRVLRDGGRAAFSEPLGTNPILAFARDHVPYAQKTPCGADTPLSYADVARWGAGFSSFDHREVQLLSMVERLVGYDARMPMLRRIDERLLKRFPSLRPLCRYVVLYGIK